MSSSSSVVALPVYEVIMSIQDNNEDRRRYGPVWEYNFQPWSLTLDQLVQHRTQGYRCKFQMRVRVSVFQGGKLWTYTNLFVHVASNVLAPERCVSKRGTMDVWRAAILPCAARVVTLTGGV